ncbi:MAG TPA: FAD-dependent oxidoreductase [Candidatus Paceibacterota bacterium]|nr:FAD-dependent oxidoreductase [Candidatus Paceibacterota bacterium]
MLYDVIIIGGGPAAVAGGVYAARKRLKTLFVAGEWGGQSIVSDDIQNWIGTPSISGADLAKSLKTHLETYKSDIVDIKEDWVQQVEKTPEGFKVTAAKGEYLGKTVLVATGASRRKLEAPGALQFDQKGLTYCATCDGPLFADRDVAVIGGGNAGFETAAQLLAYCKSVTLLHRNPEFKADAVTVEKLLKNPKFRALRNVDIVEIKGDKFVSGLTYKDKDSGENHELPVEGIFVEVGNIPATDFVKDLVQLNQNRSIIVDGKSQRTSLLGIWAAGDCTDALYHQNNIAAGDAIKALEDIYAHLHLGK